MTVENDGTARRAIYRTVGSGGSFGASPLRQHIGLGHAARIVGLGIRWPTSNTRQVTGLTKNQTVRVREQADGFTVVPRHPLPLDRGSADGRATSR